MAVYMRTLGAIAFCYIVAGCASVNRPLVIADTVVHPEVVRLAGLHNQAGRGSVYDIFVKDAQAAYPRSSLDPVDVRAQRKFMQTGFDLVKDRCRAYLSHKADRQARVRIWRDTFAPISALATGIVGLVDNGETIDNKFLTALGLATTTAGSGLSIYEERFLFDSDNLDSVRIMLDKALDADADEKMALPDSRLRYTKSVEYIVGNQLVCSPHHILQLVRGSIENANVVNRSGQNVERDDEGNVQVTTDPSPPEPQGPMISPIG